MLFRYKVDEIELLVEIKPKDMIGKVKLNELVVKVKPIIKGLVLEPIILPIDKTSLSFIWEGKKVYLSDYLYYSEGEVIERWKNKSITSYELLQSVCKCTNLALITTIQGEFENAQLVYLSKNANDKRLVIENNLIGIKYEGSFYDNCRKFLYIQNCDDWDMDGWGISYESEYDYSYLLQLIKMKNAFPVRVYSNQSISTYHGKECEISDGFLLRIRKCEPDYFERITMYPKGWNKGGVSDSTKKRWFL